MIYADFSYYKDTFCGEMRRETLSVSPVRLLPIWTA